MSPPSAESTPSHRSEQTTFNDHRRSRRLDACVLREPPVQAFRGADGAEGLRDWMQELADLVDMDLVLLGHVNSSTYTTLAFYARSGDPSIEKGDTIPIGETYCREEITAENPFVLGDAELDDVYREHPGYVNHGLRAYVGAPLYLGDGSVFGTLCAVDANAKRVDVAAVERLVEIAHEVSVEITHRLGIDGPVPPRRR